MASGIVAKKIALFEIKPQTLEQQCRLKRKHAIRRKKYRGKERRIVTREGISMIALSTSEENLTHLKDYDEDSSSSSSSTVYKKSNNFSASCSALFDLVSVESPEADIEIEDKTSMKIVPKSKKILVKSGSKDNYSKRVNIFDIDIEIKIEKKEQQQNSTSLTFPACDGVDEYEPLLQLEAAKPTKCIGKPIQCTVPVTVTTDRIHLTALVNDNDSAEKSITYYCSKCSHDHNFERKAIKNETKDKTDTVDKSITGDNNCSSSSSPEPLYQNIFSSAPPPPLSLGAPPLPPKRLFGDSFTTNYACLPEKCREKAKLIENVNTAAPVVPLVANLENAVNSVNEQSKTKTIATSDSSIAINSFKFNLKENKGKTSYEAAQFKVASTTTTNTRVLEIKIEDHVTDPSDNNLFSLKTITDEELTTKTDRIPLGKESRRLSLGNHNSDSDCNDDDEPFYEDLYDYCCNGTDREKNELLNPLLLELFRDQLNSLEQNVEDEVEYCDCSTILTLMKTVTENQENESKLPKPEINLHSTNNNDCGNFSVEPEISSLRSYEIYDDCFGVGTAAVSSQQQESEDGGKDPSTSDYNIDSMPKTGTEKNKISSSTSIGANTSHLISSHILADYIKAKVTKASTPGCWRKITSSVEETTNLAEKTNNANKRMSALLSSSSPTLSSSSSDLLSAFPSLSASKTKLAEPKRITGDKDGVQLRQRPTEPLPNEAAASSLQSIISSASKRSNLSKTKNANNECIKAYGMLKSGNDDNGYNSKPKFGGRPVVAHPLDGADGDNNSCKTPLADFDIDNDKYHSGDGTPAQKSSKKDDNEIFNKPLPLPPPNSSPYESVYEEPIYGITNQLTATYSDSGKPGAASSSPGKRRSSAPAGPYINSNKILSSTSKPGSVYSHSPSISSGSTYGYSSGSVNEYGDACSTPKHSQSGVASPCSTNATVSTIASDGMSIYGVNDKLPPTPPNKFSSIAKTAGRKIAKKFLGIRKTSKGSFEESLTTFSTNDRGGIDSSSVAGSCSSPQASISLASQGSKGINPTVTNSNSNEKITTNGINGSGGAQIRRPISRPSIPPPEPPKNDYNSTASPLPDKGNDYIYGKQNDDDYEDSDFYDSDSELIRNFVSQVQPIYSMEEEPLYQYYTYGISLKPDDDYQPVIPKNLGLTLDMLVPRVGQRSLWCELQGVVSSGILSILSDKQKQLQEAIFEILTSEVSYLKSLDVLITLFYKNEELVGVLTEDERINLFGNIENVRDCSQAFLSELLGKWEESWYIQEIGEIISRNTETRFSVYKEYCRNKPYQDKTMQKLRHTRDEFVSVVKAIEEDERCQMLQIDSFLMLPMQRITRLPLLVNAVIQRTAPGKEKNKCEESLKCLTNLVLSCNDAARESQDAEETMAILEKLEFTRGIKSLPDLGQFIMKGDFMKNPFDHGRGNQLNWTFRKAKRTFYWLLLFSKQLLVARRKANGRFEIIDMIDPLESSIKALPNLEGVSKDYKHFFMLHFSRKETVYFLAARTNSEVERWKSKLEAIKPKEELRVEAIFPYDARRSDEMSFYVGDLIRVSQMQPDGWYFGTKLATGESGWFPGNYCCENAS